MKTKQELILPFGLAVQQIHNAHKVVLASPRDPDADYCTSILAFREFLRWVEEFRKYPFERIVLYAPNRPESNSLFEVVKDLGDPLAEITDRFPADADLCVIFDHGNFHRVGISDQFPAKNLIGFDHHPGNSGFPEEGLEIVDAECSSTTMLLAYFFDFYGYSVSPQVATCLFAGFVADTGRFSSMFKNGDERPFEFCRLMAQCGGRIADVIKASNQSIPLRRYQVQNLIRTERVKVDEDLGIAFFSFSREDLTSWGVEEKDVLSVLGMLNGITEIRLAAAYHQKADGTWFCSLRSRAGFASKVAKVLGGGGHSNASGITFYDKPKDTEDPPNPDELLEKFKVAMRNVVD